MSHVSPQCAGPQVDGQALASQEVVPTPDRSFADSLKKIVRRVLRTQSCRTSFEARVLEEARRLLESCELARETLERLIVDRLVGAQQESGLEFAGQGLGGFCPPTQLRGSHSTFTPRSVAA